MNVAILAAKDRFNLCNFGAGKDDIETCYTCSTCATSHTFSYNDFSASLFNTNSCLSGDTTQHFDSIRPIVKAQWEDFFDFKCQCCALEVRVIYTPNEFRMGCYNFYLKNVLENTKNTPNGL